MKVAKQSSYLTVDANRYYAVCATAKSVAGIDTLYGQSAWRSFEALFLCLLYGGLYEGSSERRSLTGSINLV